MTGAVVNIWSDWSFARVGRSWRYSPLAAALLMALVGFWAWRHAQAFTSEIQQVVGLLDSASALPSAESIARAGEHLARARIELDALRPLAEPATGLAGWSVALPVVGRQTRRAVALWKFADSATTLGQELTSAATLGLASRENGQGASGLMMAAPALSQHLQAATSSFRTAQAARAEIGQPAWPLDPLESYFARWDAAAARLEKALPEADRLSSVLLKALGSGRPMTYLVLVQTVDDLRATGGFITSIGTVQVEGGRIGSLVFEKVYAAEGIRVPGPRDEGGPWLPPPDPLSTYMGLGQLRLRDSNWWADFPTSARQAAQFWEELKQVRVDGVIAFNEPVLETILGAVGPVEISDGRVVSADNVKDVTLSEIFVEGGMMQWYAAQTTFSQDIAKALVAAIERLPADGLLRLGLNLQSAAARGDLLVVSFDPDVGGALDDLGVTGALGGQMDDYLYLVEQNVSYGKLSPFIQHDLEYAVELDAAARPAFARLTIDVANTYTPARGLQGYPAGYYRGWRWSPETRQLDGSLGFYGGYTRLYLPRESGLLGAAGFDDGPFVSLESGRSVIGGYLALSMEARRRLQIEWTPNGTSSVPGRYRLLVQRQPGALAHSLTVRVLLPPGQTPHAVTPAPMAFEEGSIIWRTRLVEDQVYEVVLTPTRSRPAS